MNRLLGFNSLLVAICAGFLLVISLAFSFAPSSALADDMDFGNLEPEQVKKGAPTLEEGKKPLVTTAPDADGTSTAKLKNTKWDEIKRNMGAGFFQYANAKTSEWNRGQGHVDTYNYLSLEYRTGRGEKVFVRPAFLFDTSGVTSRGEGYPQSFEWHDVYLGYASYNIPWLPLDMDYKSEVRVYLPTGTLSSNEGMIARVRGDLKAHYPLTNRMSFLLWFKPDYFFQSRTAFQNGRFTNGTRDYGYELSANLFYLFRGGVWGLGSAIQHSQAWSHASVIEQVSVFQRESVSAQVFVGINAYGFLTHIGIDQEHDSLRSRTVFAGLTEGEMQYFARTYYRF